jgi:transposase
MTAEAFKFSCDLDDTPTYCGLDVHKHELAAAVFAVDDAGCEFLETGTFGTTPAQLDAFWAFARKYRPVQFAMEATGVYHHVVANFLAAQRWEVDWEFAVRVINPADPRKKVRCSEARLRAKDFFFNRQ